MPFNLYFLPPPGVYAFVCLIVYLSVCLFLCVCLDYSRANEQIFIIFYVGQTWPQEEITIFKKKSCIFRGTIFNEFSMPLAWLWYLCSEYQ